jgi:type II secretory pathway component PulC
MKTLVWTTYGHHLPLIAATMIFSWVAVSEYKKLSETRQFVNTAAPISQQTTTIQQQQAGKISELDLFGTNIQPIISAANSSVKLNGIFMATPKEKSTVALTVNGGDEQLYKSGDHIKGSGRITQIAEQYILVMNNGKPAKILLEMEDKTTGPGMNPQINPLVNSQMNPQINPGLRRGFHPAPTALPNTIPPATTINPDMPMEGDPTVIDPATPVLPSQIGPGANNPRLNPLFRGQGKFGSEM